MAARKKVFSIFISPFSETFYSFLFRSFIYCYYSLFCFSDPMELIENNCSISLFHHNTNQQFWNIFPIIKSNIWNGEMREWKSIRYIIIWKTNEKKTKWTISMSIKFIINWIYFVKKHVLFSFFLMINNYFRFTLRTCNYVYFLF